MTDDTKNSDDDWFDKRDRITIGFFSIIILAFQYNDKQWLPALACFFLTLACFTKGKIAHFFGSCFALIGMLGFLGLTVITAIEVFTAEHALPKIFVLLALLFTAPFVIFSSCFYLISRQFGFGEGDLLDIDTDMNWYKINFDDEYIYLDVNPPPYRDWKKGFKKVYQEPWKSQIKWSDIGEVSFVAEDFDESDMIVLAYKDTDKDGEVIPTEAQGGSELWIEIINRGLFDDELAMEAMFSTSGVFTSKNDNKIDENKDLS